MIIIKLYGGLGNHMTQLALYCCLKNYLPNQKIKLDYNKFKYTKFHNGLRAESVVNLPFTFNIKSSYSFYERIYYRLFEMIKEFRYKISGVKVIRSSVRENFKKIVDEISDNSVYVIDGVWNSSNYFLGYDEIVKNLFQIKPVILSDNAKKNANAIHSIDSVALHVRRADYINSQFTSLTDTSYYKDAIKVIQNRINIKQLNIFVLSDDIKWCEDNLSFLSSHKVTFVKGTKDYEDLYIMTMASNIVMANSTFSWWGAYLSEAKNIICPINFFSAKKLTKEYLRFICKDDWILI